ncbi:MAG: hypothetical protein LBE91_09765, partial [Tannerella sp.]|nr:hypothetical protein [Tannerella sp.]
EELQIIKSEIELQTNFEYEIPICPSVIGGIHIDYSGNIIVDEATGLSCHWFWLKEPKVKTLTTIYSETTINSISEKIFDYRTQQLPTLKNMIDEIPILSFGGCGGNVKFLLEKYISIHEKIK